MKPDDKLAWIPIVRPSPVTTSPPEPKPPAGPPPKASTPEIPVTSTVIKVQLATDGITLEVGGWARFFTDTQEAVNTLLSLYHYRDYELPMLVKRQDNEYGKGVRADGKNDARVLESHGLVESPPWGDPVPDILAALGDSAMPGVERRFALRLRQEVELSGIKQIEAPVEHAQVPAPIPAPKDPV